MNNNLILFPDNNFRTIVEPIIGSSYALIGKLSYGAYACSEIFIELNQDITEKKCLIVSGIYPPDKNFLSILLLADTLKRNGAGEIILFSPYLAYSRQIESGERKSAASDLILKLFNASGITKVVTVDLHDKSLFNKFPKILTSLSPAKLFSTEIKNLKLISPTVVAPDSGAVNRAKEFTREAKIYKDIVVLKKERVQSGVKVTGVVGKLSEEAIIVDDILDTGDTLVACCEKLVENGAREIYIVVTHGFFSGSGWERLWGLNVKKIFTTNSIPLPTKSENLNIKVLTVTPLIEELVKAYSQDK